MTDKETLAAIREVLTTTDEWGPDTLEVVAMLALGTNATERGN
jgi:hypothetical protein